MVRLSWALAVLVVVAVGMPSGAQTLTENIFLEDALADHPSIAAAEAVVRSASGQLRQEGVVGNPVIAWEREDPDLAARQDTLRLSWRLPWDGRRWRVAAADAGVSASISGLDSVRLSVRLEMRSLFAAWYVAQERQAALEAHLERLLELADRLRVRAEQGEAAGIAVRRFDLEVEVIEHRTATSRATAVAARAAAAARSTLIRDGIRPNRPALAVPPPQAEIGSRPDLAALSYRVAEAEAHQRSQSRRLEPPEISVGWTELRDGVQSFDGPVLGIAWPLPLFNRSQGDRQTAAAQVDRAGAELEAAKLQAAQNAEAALASYSELHRAVVGSRSSEPEVAGAVLAAFEAGEADLTDVLDALRVTIDVQMARLEVYRAALAAERELEAALGVVRF